MRRVLLGGLAVIGAGLAGGSTTTSELYEGDCCVWTPSEHRVGCRAAAFGAFLPTVTEVTPLPLRLADNDMLACKAMDNASLDNAVVLVRRGGCAFQDKLVNVAAAGGLGMVLINTDDAPFELGALDFESINAFAVAVTRSEGGRMVDLVHHATRNGGIDKLTITVRSNLSLEEQAWRRINYLIKVNAPLVAYETFFAALSPHTRELDKLLDGVVQRNGMPLGIDPEDKTSPLDLVIFFHKCSHVFSEHWEYEQEISFHAAVAAAVLLTSESVSSQNLPATLRRDVFNVASMKLLSRGYYTHALSLLEVMQVKEPSAATRCLALFVKFLRGSVSTAIVDAKGCDTEIAQFNVTGTGLEVPHDNFLRLVAMDVSSEGDDQCITALTSEDLTVPGITRMTPCCRRRIHSLSDDLQRGEEPLQGAAINRRTFWYQSTFIEELHHTLNIMGVFLDELGAFQESLTFFRHAARLCEDWSLSTEFRRALAVPIVFDSEEDTDAYMMQLRHNIGDLLHMRDRQERILSSLAGVENYADFFSRPEDATYLRYTITPPTMFIGYQGHDVLSLQRTVFTLRTKLFPSLNSRYRPLNSLFQHSERPQRRRIAFVSTWFRNHSVGKLILGVIKRLDRKKFHVMVYRAVHFLRASDELTKQFHHEADSYMELPVDVDDAIALLRHEAIDVLVFPELGMDMWTLLLSHHRVAPVQCVFWGHPITTGNPSIDYFITSEFFISDFFEDNWRPQRDEDSTTEAWPGTYHGSSFSEQIVLFRGLSTFFTNKFPSGRTSSPFQRSMLHLPATARLYVCPQTLMKLHVDFDAVLLGILSQDQHAWIILLSSPSQRVWKEQLRRRFRHRFGEAHRRVVFFSTLPYEDFVGLLSAADVVLDPFPFGGGVTTLDALAVGTPVVTLPSRQTVPQLAAGFLRYIGVTSTIARSVDEYIAMSLAIAHDAVRHHELRTQILAQHQVLYEDAETVADWDAFLATVDIDETTILGAAPEEPTARVVE